jgi:uncharacterized protein YegL
VNKTEEKDDQFALLGQTTGFGFGNFDPANVQEDEVILAVIAMDISPSIQGFQTELNEAFEAFITEMQGSHVANKLMVKVVTFNEKVEEKTGFMPIKSLDVSHFQFRASGNSTALADAGMLAVKTAVDYRTQLENTGINVKTLVFVITDGQENSSKVRLSDVKVELDALMQTEANVFSFETILFGIGDRSYFEPSQKEMGFKHLAAVGTTGKEIRKLIGFISASISKSSSNQVVSF